MLILWLKFIDNFSIFSSDINYFFPIKIIVTLLWKPDFPMLLCNFIFFTIFSPLTFSYPVRLSVFSHISNYLIIILQFFPSYTLTIDCGQGWIKGWQGWRFYIFLFSRLTIKFTKFNKFLICISFYLWVTRWLCYKII